MPWYLQVLLVIIWFAIGIILVTPYAYLAGSGWFGAEPVGIVLAPVAAVALYVVWHFRGSRWRGWTFWLLTIYCCLPILLNGISAVLKLFGWIMPANAIFNFRYFSFYIPVALFILLLIVSFVVDFIKKMARSFRRKAVIYKET